MNKLLHDASFHLKGGAPPLCTHNYAARMPGATQAAGAGEGHTRWEVDSPIKQVRWRAHGLGGPKPVRRGPLGSERTGGSDDLRWRTFWREVIDSTVSITYTL